VKTAFKLILIAALLYFFKLGSFSLYDAAETTYGEFIKNILHSGDWLTLHYNGQIIFDKPPLYYWLAALLSRMIGFNEWAVRFWAALAGVLTAVTTYKLGKTFYNERTGVLSAIIAMTSFQFLIQSRIAELDIVLTLFMLSTILLFYQGYRSGNKNYYLLAYLPMALGMLIKGLLAVALPSTAIILFLLIKREAGKLKELHIIPGLLIILLVGMPWYIAEYMIHGQVFLEFALGFLFLSRFQGVVSGHTGPWYYYFPAVLLGFAPWSQFLPFSLWQSFKRWKNDPELLSLCFMIPAFIVFSIAKTKIPNYILPIFPFLAIGVARVWDDFLSDPKGSIAGFRLSNLFFAFIIFLIIIGFIMVGHQNYPSQYASLVPGLIALAAVLIAGGALSIIFFFLKAYRLSFSTIPIMVFIITSILTVWVLPQVETFKGAKPLGQELARIIKPADQVAAFGTGNRPSVVLHSPQPVIFLDSERQLISFLQGKNGYVFTTPDIYEKMRLSLPKTTKILDKKGDLLIVYE